MSDYETIQAKRNIVVGIFVMAAMCSLVWLIYKFGDLPTSVSKIGSFQVLIQFPIAQGLQKDTPVRFCGYPIGRVTSVKSPKVLEDLNTGKFYHQAIVVLSIDNEYDDIPSNVEVKLMTRGLGSSYIELVVDPDLSPKPIDPDKPVPAFLQDGMYLQGSTGMTSEFFPEESQRKLDELANSLKSFMNNANDIIGDTANKENLKKTLANLSEASQQATLALKDFQKFSVAATDLSEQLSKTTVELRQILEKVNEGEGTAAKLVNDARLYENLLENTHQMHVLLGELRTFVAKSSDAGLPIKLK